jgi:branched-chain amino acid transport system substrate-binding protein
LLNQRIVPVVEGVAVLVPSSSSGEPWRVGVLFSQTGWTSVAERTQLHGTLLAIEEINARGGINGRELQPVIRDPASDLSRFRQFAKYLMTEDRVTTIFGCYTSSSRKAVMPVVERLNGLLWYPTQYEGFEFSPNVIYTGAAPNQNCIELCRYLLEKFGRRFYFIGSDYVYPRELNRIMREFLVGHGGMIVAESYMDLRSQRSDFSPILEDIKDSGADVVFSTVVGQGTRYLYQAYKDAGLDPATLPIASLTTTEAEIAEMGLDVGEGHITAASYFEGLPGDASGSFVARYRKRFGPDEPTNACAEAAYFQVLIFAKALEKANSMATDVLRSFALGSSIQAPQGKVRINSHTGHADLWTRIGRANRRGQFDLIRQSLAPVQANPFMICAGPNRTGPEDPPVKVTG